MKKVLLLNPYYEPGYRSGGPQQTIKNLVDVYGSRCQFFILTQNHDKGSEVPYEGIQTDIWLDVGKAKVKYLSAKNYDVKHFKREYRHFDIIYTCGMFEKNSRLMLAVHRFCKREKKPLYLAPMGVFSQAAIHSKSFKKQAFLKIYRKLGMFRDVIWSFTSELEREDAVHVLGDMAVENRYVIAEDLPRSVDFAQSKEAAASYCKKPGELRVVFLSRICPQKNLEYGLQVLDHVYQGKIIFDIYGTKEDELYWKRCAEQIQRLPGNITVNDCGELRPEGTVSLFQSSDVLLLPTKGENYGHVIYEALAAGCIPVISDRTPWLELEERGCGHVISLQRMEQFQTTMQKWMDAGEEEMRKARRRAVEYAERKYREAVDASGYEKIFEMRWEDGGRKKD